MRLVVAAARTRTEHREWESRRRDRRRGDAAGQARRACAASRVRRTTREARRPGLHDAARHWPVHAVGPVYKIWILQVAYIKSIARLIGKPTEVDSSSLNRSGPVRIRVLCRDPWLIEGASVIFVNSTGYKVKWVPELEGQRKDKQYPDEFKLQMDEQNLVGSKKGDEFYKDEQKESSGSSLVKKTDGANKDQKAKDEDEFDVEAEDLSDEDVLSRIPACYYQPASDEGGRSRAMLIEDDLARSSAMLSEKNAFSKLVDDVEKENVKGNNMMSMASDESEKAGEIVVEQQIGLDENLNDGNKLVGDGLVVDSGEIVMWE
ncbi:hypothetical protein GUJ93_ZPchr0001g31752 [Zizania palustris]|uniref:DUF4283 domain-containing protein n=1 Tax=Zizania palustris TaxID=103762 RepID=A0A8J5VTK7_ZIZPA|nr:hypothetical protein GUJ93_ZPchr0001g31752 [Zizania palustris]